MIDIRTPRLAAGFWVRAIVLIIGLAALLAAIVLHLPGLPIGYPSQAWRDRELIALFQVENSRHTAAAKALISRGASPNAREKLNLRTILMEAAKSGDTDLASFLIEHGADANARSRNGDTALMNASRRGSADTIELLIQRGAEVNARDVAGRTALWWAVRVSQAEAAAALRSHGGRAEPVVTIHASTGARRLARFSIWSAVANDDAGAVKALLDKGVEINLRYGFRPFEFDVWGDQATPLIGAASLGRLEIVKLLAERGADVNAQDASGRTALIAAVMNGHAEVASRLLDHGADATRAGGFPSMTALAWAAELGHHEIYKRLQTGHAH